MWEVADNGSVVSVTSTVCNAFSRVPVDSVVYLRQYRPAVPSLTRARSNLSWPSRYSCITCSHYDGRVCDLNCVFNLLSFLITGVVAAISNPAEELSALEGKHKAKLPTPEFGKSILRVL